MAQLEELALPLGYRFKPTSLELLLHFLKNKILGLDLPSDIIPTFDCFSCNPDQLPLHPYKYGIPNQYYFFSEGRNGEVVLTEDGYYDVCGLKEVCDANGLVGFVTTLNFYHGKPPAGTKSQWTIKEFRLNPDLIQVRGDDHETQERISNLVACKIIIDKPLETKNGAVEIFEAEQEPT